jgi:hypothetical protein
LLFQKPNEEKKSTLHLSFDEVGQPFDAVKGQMREEHLAILGQQTSLLLSASSRTALRFSNDPHDHNFGSDRLAALLF